MLRVIGEDAPRSITGRSGVVPDCGRDAALPGLRPAGRQAATTAGIGSAVIDLIFSIAKREVTFFSDTELISFL